jgi:hypothetical protein
MKTTEACALGKHRLCDGYATDDDETIRCECLCHSATAEPEEFKSWAAEVIADGSGKFAGNGLRFATKEEAETYVADLASRWTLVRETRVVPSTDEVTA